MLPSDRGDQILGAIYDDVDHHLNPDDAECWNCGGEGYAHDCFDGCCENAEDGCEDCARRCPECVIFAGQRAKAVREAVIELADADVAIAWLKEIGRWHDGITRETVIAELAIAKAASLSKDSEPLSQIREG